MAEDDHSHIWRAIEGLRGDSISHGQVQQRTDLRLADIQDTLDKIVTAIGQTSTDDHGSPVGTGIRGDVMRIRLQVEQRFSIYDGWNKYAKGAAAALAISAAILWWLISDKLEHLFR